MADEMTLTKHDAANGQSNMLWSPPPENMDLVDLAYPTMTAIQVGLGPKFSELKRTGAVTLTAEHLFQMLQNAFDSGVSAAVEQHHNDDKVMEGKEKLEQHLNMQSDEEKAAMDVDSTDLQDVTLTQLQKAIQQKDQDLEAWKRIIMKLKAKLKAQDVEMAKLRGKRAAYIVGEFENRMFR